MQVSELPVWCHTFFISLLVLLVSFCISALTWLWWANLLHFLVPELFPIGYWCCCLYVLYPQMGEAIRHTLIILECNDGSIGIFDCCYIWIIIMYRLCMFHGCMLNMHDCQYNIPFTVNDINNNIDLCKKSKVISGILLCCSPLSVDSVRSFCFMFLKMCSVIFRDLSLPQVSSIFSDMYRTSGSSCSLSVHSG